MSRTGFLALDRPLSRSQFAIAATAVLLVDVIARLPLIDESGPSLPMALFLTCSGLMTLSIPHLTDGEWLVWLALSLATSLVMTVLALRRSADAAQPGFVAALAMVPAVRLPLILYLALMPSVPAAVQPGAIRARVTPVGKPAHTMEWMDATLAVFIGAGIAVATIAIGALLFGSYQYGMFVLAPFFIGVTAGYLLNFRADTGLVATTKLIALTTLVGSIALVALALEGVVCIIVVAPLGFCIAWLGGAVGRGMALAAIWRRTHVFGALLLIPFVLAFDDALERPLEFEMQSAIEISAPPAAVWDALVDMKTIRAEPGLPFRLGVAYPLRSETLGEGVGALRHGEFSTGTAVERVTVWDQPWEFGFEVLSEPPAMRELSLYDEVHAPHVHGYFRTAGGTFRLQARADGGTHLVAHTRHSVRLEPFAYWLPPARWIVKQNQERVLRHIEAQAEEDPRF